MALVTISGLPGSGTSTLARAVAEALDAGADLLVIGRAVTAADDPITAAETLVTSLS